LNMAAKERRIFFAFAFAVVPLLAIALNASQPRVVDGNAEPVLAHAATGVLRGAASGGVARFFGAPYAAAPIGDLRWRLPQPAAPWDGERDATQFGAICPQPDFGATLPAMAEDCLSLNIYAPFPMTRGRKVMVWIHGGVNTTGSGSFYDPTLLVKEGGVIVVTLNYRLGALGFLALADFHAESGATGDYGVADQQLALRWVRDNIAAFGGDPDDVTLFGESSGGLNVLTHLVSPLSAGLFRKAIVQSGAFGLDTQGLQASQAQGSAFAAALGCSAKAAPCLRAKPVAAILAAQGDALAGTAVYALATVDGLILPTTQRAALEAGRFQRGPVLYGNNGAEGRLFTPPNLSAARYPATLQGYAQSAGTSKCQIVDVYPLADYPTPGEGAAAAYGDMSFACPDRALAPLLARHVPAYEYSFDDAPPASIAPLGPTHGAELRYLFSVSHVGAPFDGDPSTLPGDSQELARAMRRYWTDFARNGAPNGSGGPDWPPVISGKIQEFIAPRPYAQDASDFSARHKCAYWRRSAPASDCGEPRR
jgi:para-nitrobenzyl esterase